jgi:cap2 methyltransferase
MNTASTIVPHLREHCHVEVGTQAWAKMFEILSNFDLIHPRNDQPWRSLHLCEAPGAFISALNHFLQTRKESLVDPTKDIQWQWFAQTLNPYYEHSPATGAMLIDDDRLIFHTIDDDHWDFGCDNSGNLLNPENIEHYIQRFQSMEIDLVTADGSFDVQDNPSEQELLVYPLLKAEIKVALACLRTHGHFVIKFFTVFEPATIDLISSLYQSFAQVGHLVVFSYGIYLSFRSPCSNQRPAK